ncbi:hypothetical protein MKW94_014504 [Papaver nudicaule]|uniref:Glycosyltransferase N-terminal domain-containing protein n=1 Tax=Papaver nudicaule TaxID=74823 RepID=A0AA41S389_PAPNU|nr:hypothetical protein [Papaver nudicaule]
MASHNQDQDQLHIVMVPWLAFGHLNPFLELSVSLANMGHHISFITTPRNIQRLLPNLSPNLHSSSRISFVSLPLPKDENLRDQAESTIDLPSEEVPYLKRAYDGLEGPVSSFLETSKPDWIIHDFAPYWLPAIASRLNIPCCFFTIFNASVNCFFGPPSVFWESGENDTSSEKKKPMDLTVPPSWIPFPSNLAFRSYEFGKVFGTVEIKLSGVTDGHRISSAINGCEIMAIRSCLEVESEFLALLGNLFKKQVIPVGLLPPPPPSPDMINELGDTHEEWVQMRKWLDKQEQGSVVYIALGTEAALSQLEITELALGLELSKLPFFWVLRKPTGSTEDPLNMLPVGFVERSRENGFMCMSWAPQMRILQHPAIGGFLNHCGWSSVIEALGFGCPLILLPMVNDQPLNARTMVWKEMGLEIERNEEDGSFSRESVAKSLRSVMVNADGEKYRCKARELKQVFGNELLNDGYVEKFCHYLKEHKRSQIG